MPITRRGILLGAGATGGLILAWALTPRSFPPPLPPGEGEVAFDAWLKIGTDGVITVAVPELEMGQGITTLIPQIVAQELGADWRQLAVEPVPVSGAFANVPLAARWSALWLPLLSGLANQPDALLARRFAETEPFTATADGTSLIAHEAAARIAAASARAMLAQAAAKRWGVAWEECDAADGHITHGKQRLPFAQLVEAAAGFDAPYPPSLRAQPPGENPAEVLPGAPLRFPRLDLPAKVDGSFSFAGDVRLPDMVYAAIRHGPIGDTRLGGYDTGQTKGVQGLMKLVNGPNWLAAVASDWWAAERALTLIAPRFAAQDRAGTAATAQALDQALRRGRASRIAETGDPDNWLSSKFEHVAHYWVAPALHATLETATATARLTGGKLELWAATQAPQAARRAAAAALDIAVENVVLYPMPAGGSFDRRLEHDHIAEVALIARQAGKPVQLIWSRWQEHVAGLPRTPARAVLAARTAPDGTLVALKVRIAAPASFHEFGERLLHGKTPHAARHAQVQGDAMTVEGAVPPYAIPHLVVEHVPAAIPLPTARMRGNAHGYTCFFIETFIDELAARARREPLSYRIAMLGHDIRLATCLQRAATLAEWNGGASGSGQGLACHQMTIAGRTGRIALVANARQDERGIRTDKLTAVVDIGRVVNADIARQQIEGGLLFGLGLARGCSTAYADGLPLTGRLGALGLPLLADCPDIEVDFIESTDEPFDPGELGVAVAAPALANALFAAGSTRLRNLPLTAVPA
ncbi:molybdopterin cofactor-binding domain-containing protein [Novosphingobium sp.]|uniref:molybdopterin cofactor-binding domain-containing protein n=1 Tax=Novosphingobium sp. TaxID=1874826 RepID=UPI002732B9D9|nr:molybdopterin cofactor-binding domain-containing protein [Novosphingobium sp.]MDP3907777.1 molybdopterin-dependent oxidoreductase [Novosphingobium sp.]